MKYFDYQFINFFKTLETNNSKEWFHSNKDTYLDFVDKPFQEFVSKLLEVIKKMDSSIDIETNEAIFRINKDIRFSKDKSPYKLFKSALISSKGRKSKKEPGFYLEMGSENIKIAGGCFKLTPNQIKLIEKNIQRVYDISLNPTFKAYCGDLIKTKNSLTFETTLSSSLIYSDDLDVLILTHWQIMKPIISVFKEILGD